MREQVLRAATLCFFGNEYLRLADDASLTEVYLKACFKGVESLEFVRPSAHQLAAPGTGFVHGSKTWFRRLKTDGVENLRLHLPISILEALPAEYGIVTDGDIGSNIWVPSPESTKRNVEYDAKRFAVWSLPRVEPSAASFASMIQGMLSVSGVLKGQTTPLAQSIHRLAGILGSGANAPSGFDDSIPPSFNSTQTALAKSAIHAVVVLGNPDLGLALQPSLQEEIDGIWQLALRVLEAVSAEALNSQSKTQAA